MKTLIKTTIISLQFILIVSFLILLYGLVTRRGFSLNNVFNANFFIGSVIILVGIIIMILPTRFFKFDKLSDHSTIIHRYVEHRELKREKASVYIFTGILMIMITGVIQLVIWMILNRIN